MLNKMAELEDQYNAITATEVMTPKVCEAAKELRLKYVKVRTGTAEIHKKAKAYYLAGGRFVDGWKNAQAFASQGKEEKLIEIEKHFERIEEERIRQIEENRKELLKPYTYAVPDALGWMTDDTFEIYLQGAKQQYIQELIRTKDWLLSDNENKEQYIQELIRTKDWLLSDNENKEQYIQELIKTKGIS